MANDETKDETRADVARIMCRVDCAAGAASDDCKSCEAKKSWEIYLPQVDAMLEAGAIVPGWRLPKAPAA